MWKQGPVDYKKILKKGQQYRDEDFPIGLDALYWSDKTFGMMKSKADMVDSWRRLYFEYPDSSLFGNSDYTNDVGQGMLGDCYFLASCVAFAENDQRFKNIWLSKEQSDVGIYAMKGYIRGVQSVLTVDDYVPFIKEQPIFAKLGFDGSVWGPIIEKMFAKYNGNYENINGGLEPQAFQFLTGAPNMIYFLDEYNPEEIWDILDEGNSTGFIMAAGTQMAPGGDTVNNEFGLAYNHAYTILSTHEVKDDSGQKLKLYRMRNPWRRDGLYKGQWRDADSHWTKALQDQVIFKDMDDGIFYITYRDFMDAFGSVTVCHFFDDWVFSTFEVVNEHQMNKQLEFELEKDTEMYIMFDFYDPRMYPHGCKVEDTDVFITVVDQDDRVLCKALTSDLYQGLNYVQIQQAKKGKYYVDINVMWTNIDIRDYTFRIYAPMSVQIKELKNNKFFQEELDKSKFQLNPLAQVHQQLQSYSKNNPQNQDLKKELIEMIEQPDLIDMRFNIKRSEKSWYKIQVGNSRNLFDENKSFKFLFILSSSAKTENSHLIDLDLIMYLEVENGNFTYASSEIGTFCQVENKKRLTCKCEIRQEEGKKQCAILMQARSKIRWGFGVQDFRVRK